MISTAVAALLSRATPLEPALAGLLARLVSVVLTAAALLIIYRLLLRVIDRVARPRDGEPSGSPRAVRSRTLASLLTNVARWMVAFVGLVIVLRELGIDVQALLVSAGVLGLAVGLGAQTLIKDVITGFFLLFEGLIAIGDVIEVGPHTGTVEAVGLRVTKLRMLDGAVRVVPNGQLTEFTNYNRGWARAVVDVPVPYDVAVGRALALLAEVGTTWAETSGRALDRPEAQGIIRFEDDSLVLRLMVRVDPATRFATEVELRRRIKEAFERERIVMTPSRRLMTFGAESETSP